jgi:diguanylate cyclase (GGDEF)-like protein
VQIAKQSTNPLSALPSVLAIRDIRRRVRRAFAGTSPSADTARAMLALDPPAVLRGMRAAMSPVYRLERDTWSVGSIVDALGPSLTRRLLDTPATDITGTGPIRQLWLHAIATAHAARMLARTVGILDPEEAYLLGLLHDLPLWLQFLGRRHRGASPPGNTEDWLRHWNLPQRLAAVIEQVQGHRALSRPPTPVDAATLVCAAELIAELAEFVQPYSVSPRAVFAMLGKEEFLTAQRLRREVKETLEPFGLDLVLPEPDLDLERLDSDDELELFAGKHSGDIHEIVLSVLGCSKAASYRSIVTATTSAALRYLGYDRAWYVKWIRPSNRFMVRAKADLSSRRVGAALITTTPAEQLAVATAFDTERPVRMEALRNGEPGLLQRLGADEALIVPLNREFATPALLLLDRSISTRPIHLLQDSDKATTLALTTTLLTENLLLKRRRTRAQKFALTDPLTRLFNRTMGIRTLELEITRSRVSLRPLTVLMVDLDNFKRLNDTHGHVLGDHALRDTAEVLHKTLRRTDTLCRYGGEEFLVVLPETTPEDATVLATRLFTAVESRGYEAGLPTTVSIGLASLRPEDTVEALLARADQALYASKQQGRNRFSADVD